MLVYVAVCREKVQNKDLQSALATKIYVANCRKEYGAMIL